MNPEHYPCRRLLCVSGLSPQIVTETLYALTVLSEPHFVPTEVHLLTTAEGADRARLTLLSEEPGWFHRLCKDYGLPEIRFTLVLLCQIDLFDFFQDTYPAASCGVVYLSA
jgi:CRISPR-associated protein (TIGR02584 family)